MSKPFITGHEELIHDVKYDFYGKHLATASSDQHLKVFDLDPNSQTWVVNDSWKAHDASIVRVSWANPEFSSSAILASCSYDRTVKIWQEQPDELQGSGRRWMRLATLAIESHGPIYDVVFAPAHLGLKLACVGCDGILRIYESLEPSDLTAWALTTEIPLLGAGVPAKTLQSTFSVEWCPAKFTSTEKLIVVAIDQAFIFGAPPEGDQRAQEFDLQGSGPEPIPGESSTTVRYRKIATLPEHNGLIRSVSWAPSMGRSYHLIASACKDGYVRIFKGKDTPSGDLRIEMVAKLGDHKSEVWRVHWNATGTILSSAGDDGKIRLWKCNYLSEWKCMSVINSSNRSENRVVDDQGTDH
ncbi:nucleoporin Seh1p [Diutina catenulata]